MRLLMTRGIPTSATTLRLGTMLLVLISAVSGAVAQTGGHRPLPTQVLSTAPGIHPFGKGRHSWWRVWMYDATLWIVVPQWSAAAPNALHIDPRRPSASDA